MVRINRAGYGIPYYNETNIPYKQFERFINVNIFIKAGEILIRLTNDQCDKLPAKVLYSITTDVIEKEKRC